LHFVIVGHSSSSSWQTQHGFGFTAGISTGRTEAPVRHITLAPEVLYGCTGSSLPKTLKKTQSSVAEQWAGFPEQSVHAALLSGQLRLAQRNLHPISLRRSSTTRLLQK